MINLEVPKKFRPLVDQAHQVAMEVFRPISRKYDEADHAYPKELDMLAALIDGMSDGGESGGAGAAGVRRSGGESPGVRNGSNMSTALSIMELCWGDVGLLLSMPRQGLGNSAIASVADDEQRERFNGMWAAMAITEPEAGSDSAAIRTTAVLDEDTGEYVLNGEKIFVTSGERADLIVVWATLDRSLGRAAIKSLVAAMAVGLTRACLDETRRLLAGEGVCADPDTPAALQSAAAAELLSMDADYESARLLTLQASWMADNSRPNSLQASMAKAKAGRTCVDVAMRCVRLCGPLGYAQELLLEKWARDAKILDLFEGTQQIQLLIIARQLLGKTSAELR